MKRCLTVAVAMLALTGMGQVAMRKLEDLTNTNLVCVTDYGPQVVSLTQRVTGIEGNTNAWSKTVANLTSLSNNVASLSSRVDATNALFSAWFGSLFNSTSNWSTAFGWGDWHSAVAGKLDSAATNGWETGSHAAFLTNETDLAALRLYHYGSPDIVESPEEWFAFNGAGTITGINSASVTNWNIVIPWQIGLVPVTAIGYGAFAASYTGLVIAPQTVTTIGESAFSGCFSLTSINLPQATAIGNGAFSYCESLTAVHMGRNAPAGATGVFDGITPPPTVYVANPNATGWGATWNGAPVVRLPLHADAITLDGVTRTSWPTTDVSGLATTQSVNAVAGDLDLLSNDLNNHTDNGAIGSDAHASSIEKAAWNAKLDASGGTASNLTVTGFIALPQTAPTNLVLRLVCSNEHIYVEEVYP